MAFLGRSSLPALLGPRPNGQEGVAPDQTNPLSQNTCFQVGVGLLQQSVHKTATYSKAWLDNHAMLSMASQWRRTGVKQLYLPNLGKQTWSSSRQKPLPLDQARNERAHAQRSKRGGLGRRPERTPLAYKGTRALADLHEPMALLCYFLKEASFTFKSFPVLL